MSQVKYKGFSALATGRPSLSILSDCPIAELKDNPAKGLYLFEDFLTIPGLTTVKGNLWYPIIGTGCSVNQLKDNNGVVQLLHDGTDNDIISLSTGNNVSGITKITSLMQTKWWFETRFKLSSVTDDHVAVFVGLAEEALSAQTGLIADSAAALADKDILGFYVDDGDGNDLTVVHSKQGDAVTTVSQTGLITLVADTYVQVGFKFEPARNEIDVYLNGAVVGTPISCALATFPSAQDLAIYLVCKAMGSASTDSLAVDWVALAHENYA
jgi:hypothetical protein